MPIAVELFHPKPIANSLETVTGLSTAKGFASLPDRARLAVVQVEGQPIRYRDDGGTPTASVGIYVAPYDIVEVDSNSLKLFRAIETAASAQLNVSYYE